VNERKSANDKPIRFRVVVRRRNGRFVRSHSVPSRYAAKMKIDELEEKYKDTDFSIETEDGPSR